MAFKKTMIVMVGIEQITVDVDGGYKELVFEISISCRQGGVSISH